MFQGNRRTVNLAMCLYHKTELTPVHGAVMRMVFDMNNQDYVEMCQDVGIEQTITSAHRTDLT